MFSWVKKTPIFGPNHWFLFYSWKCGNGKNPRRPRKQSKHKMHQSSFWVLPLLHAHMSICSSTPTPIHLSMSYSLIHPYLPIQVSTHPSIHVSIHPSIPHPSIYPVIHAANIAHQVCSSPRAAVLHVGFTEVTQPWPRETQARPLHLKVGPSSQNCCHQGACGL